MITPPVIFYKRFIDDVLGIWLPPATNDVAAWEAFQLQMNDYYGLKWIFSNLSDTVDFNFMDPRLSLINSRIHSSLYEKALNHHLYTTSLPIRRTPLGSRLASSMASSSESSPCALTRMISSPRLASPPLTRLRRLADPTYLSRCYPPPSS
jgi:hypothetical protein